MKRILFSLALLLALPLVVHAQAGSTGPGSPSWKGTPHGVNLTCTETGTAIGFNFYRATVSGGPYIKLNSALMPTCAFLDSTSAANGPATSTTYFYVATAVDASGNESGYSLEASAVTPATFQTDPAAPAKPTATIL